MRVQIAVAAVLLLCCGTEGQRSREDAASAGSPPGAPALATPAGSAPPTPPVSSGPATRARPTFELAWQDDFERVDPALWVPQTHTWDGNQAQFTAANVSAENGILRLWLTPAAAGALKPFLGVEYRSTQTLVYGKIEASARFARGSGVVSSLVSIYTPWPPDDWNELDIECLGRSTGTLQFNHMVNIPPADPASAHLQFPALVDLGSDPTSDFHTYGIEWLPEVVRFYVDGRLLHEATKEVARLVRPQNILLTIWASDAAGWAGAIDATTAPTSAEYAWLRVYRYVPE